MSGGWTEMVAGAGGGSEYERRRILVIIQIGISRTVFWGCGES